MGRRRLDFERMAARDAGRSSLTSQKDKDIAAALHAKEQMSRRRGFFVVNLQCPVCGHKARVNAPAGNKVWKFRCKECGSPM